MKNTILTLSLQAKLFKEGMLPVYKSSLGGDWQRIKGGPIDNTIEQGDKCIEITFKHQFDNLNESVQFAFTYPWSYQDD